MRQKFDGTGPSTGRTKRYLGRLTISIKRRALDRASPQFTRATGVRRSCEKSFYAALTVHVRKGLTVKDVMRTNSAPHRLRSRVKSSLPGIE